jgi:threonine dehydrogenase-like Zn-dependent dehydrogenase
VVVIGLGPIGQLSARLHAITGAKVIGADVSEQRVKMLREAGVEAVVVEGSLKESLADHLPLGADVVVDATGASPVMKEAISTIREMPWTPEPGPAPKYIIQGSYPGAVELPYQEFFMSETEVRIPRDCRPEELSGVLDLMARDKLKVSDLISEIAKPDEAPGIYQRLLERGTPLVTVAFEWQ